ncbi:hypothetical protein MIND_00168500 [Mycena indigotica]|uniref:C2H2-type domain-containing protein n=1 Tax=Mycena indigotica TaxID=2126181 RepID=A0A8H6WL64_9AGAR|nr:uncharacterized protein MIND_00168500 [Mycena indigotica]KAF7316494.1 hypothetical protein MIND_00168500 [Mycena indigotica]
MLRPCLTWRTRSSINTLIFVKATLMRWKAYSATYIPIPEPHNNGSSAPEMAPRSCDVDLSSLRAAADLEDLIANAVFKYKTRIVVVRLVPLTAPARREFACDLCPLSFDRHHDLKRHIETHSGEKPHICECGKAFTRKDALKRHKTTFPFCPPQAHGSLHPASSSSSQIPHSYGHSQPSTVQHPAYGHHSPQFTGHIPANPSGWSNPYGAPPSLQYGDITSGANYSQGPQYPGSTSPSQAPFVPPPLYGGDYPASPTRPYACDICPLSFDRHHDLKRHRITHAGERPHICNGCDKTFTRKDALKRHQMAKECGRPGQ